MDHGKVTCDVTIGQTKMRTKAKGATIGWVDLTNDFKEKCKTAKMKKKKERKMIETATRNSTDETHLSLLITYSFRDSVGILLNSQNHQIAMDF